MTTEQNLIQAAYSEHSAAQALVAKVFSAVSINVRSYTLPLYAFYHEPRSNTMIKELIIHDCVNAVPQKEMVARRLLSSGGAHLLQIPWQAG